jgi:hypothetical protein
MEATLNHPFAEVLPPTRAPFAEAVAIREATLADSRAIDALATLDSSHRPHGRLLVAEVDGDLVAALPIEGGPPVADPFRRTSELVALLEARAAQLRGRRRRRTPLLRPRLA